MRLLSKILPRVLLAWMLLSDMVGPGIGPGVSHDFKPLRREEESSYRYEERTRQEYDNAEAERRGNDERLFEDFYLREAKARSTSLR